MSKRNSESSQAKTKKSNKKRNNKGKTIESNKLISVDDGLWAGKDVFSIVVFLLFLGFILYPPFLRGLFFEQQLFPSLTLLSLLFMTAIIDQWRRRKLNFVRSYLDIAMLGYLLIYLLSLLAAVDQRTAIIGAMRAFMFYAVYWMASNLIENKRQYEILINVLLAGAVGVTLVGIGSAVGVIDYHGAFQYGRFYSTWQYPNATAAYLGAFLLAASACAVKTRNAWWRSAYVSITSLLAMGMIGTISKGGFVVAVLGLLLLSGLAAKGDRIRLIFTTLAALVLGGFASKVFLGQVVHSQGTKPLVTVVLLVVIGFGMGFLWSLLENKILGAELGSRRGFKWKALSVAGIAAVIGLFFFKSIIPASLLQRFTEFGNLNNTSFVTRIDFVRWAWAIMKDHPLLGTGAGGWNALYHQYQDYLYWTTETHSHIFQVGVEVGITGLLIYLIIWGLHAWKLYELKSSVPYDLAALGVGVGALVLFLHSSFDFDFSIPGLQLIAWVLVGSVGSVLGSERDNLVLQSASFKNVCAAIAVVLSIGVLYCSANMASGFNDYTSGNKLIQKKQTQQAINMFQKAAEADPWCAKYRVSLGLAYCDMFMNTGRTEYKELADAEAKKAEHLNPHDLRLKQGLISIYQCTRNSEGSTKAAWAAILDAPLNVQYYESLSTILVENAKYLGYTGDMARARQYAEEVLKVPDSLVKNKASLNPKRIWLWQGPKLEIGPRIQLNMAIAEFILGKYQISNNILAKLQYPDTQTMTEADILRAALNYAQGGNDYPAMVNKAAANDKTAPAKFEVYKNISLRD